MSLLRLVEGIISTRPTVPLGDFTTDGLQAAATDVPFDFGGLRKDVHVECDQPILIKFNVSTVPGQAVASGAWDWTGNFANKAYVTFAVPTNFKMRADG
jgi:hypothetical protein